MRNAHRLAINMSQDQNTQERPPPQDQPLYQFEDMHLKVGDRLQVQLPNNVAEDRQIVKLIGYLDKQCLFVTAPAAAGLQRFLIEGDRIVVRIFSGQGAFGFVSFVDRIIRQPFEYLHLSFPREIQGLMIRKAPRVKTEIGVVVETSSAKADAVVSNLSATGMSLRTETPLGAKGDELSCTLPLALYDVKTELKLRGRIRAITSLPVEGGGERHQFGVEFLEVKPDETLILQSVVHYELQKNPYSVV
jgi:hypothetical protein